MCTDKIVFTNFVSVTVRDVADGTGGTVSCKKEQTKTTDLRVALQRTNSHASHLSWKRGERKDACWKSHQAPRLWSALRTSLLNRRPQLTSFTSTLSRSFASFVSSVAFFPQKSHRPGQRKGRGEHEFEAFHFSRETALYLVEQSNLTLSQLQMTPCSATSSTARSEPGVQPVDRTRSSYPHPPKSGASRIDHKRPQCPKSSNNSDRRSPHKIRHVVVRSTIPRPGRTKPTSQIRAPRKSSSSRCVSQQFMSQIGNSEILRPAGCGDLQALCRHYRYSP